jgi:hypothetical protein
MGSCFSVEAAREAQSPVRRLPPAGMAAQIDALIDAFHGPPYRL